MLCVVSGVQCCVCVCGVVFDEAKSYIADSIIRERVALILSDRQIVAWHRIDKG